MRLQRLAALIVLTGLAIPGTAPARVEIEGVRGALRDNVLAHLVIDETPCEAPVWRISRLNRQAPAQIREALEAYGYYNPSISISAGTANGCWLTTIRIDPGTPVRLRSIDVQVRGAAAGEPAFARLLKSRAFQPGDILNHRSYDRFKASFADLARQLGYFAGRFETSRIDVYAQSNAADVTLHYDSGPRYRFGPVSFEQSVVRDELVERFVDFRPGDPYDGVRVSDFYNALLGTGYFATVDLRTRPGTLPDVSVPISVALTAAKPKVYTVGVGYSTDNGIKLRGGYTNRLLNRSGHQLDATANLSRVLSEVGVSYRLPRRDPRVEWLSLSTGYQHKDTTTSRSDIFKVGVKELHRRPREWVETRFIDASTERYEIGEESARREFLLIPGISWSRTVPGNSLVTRPEKGHRLSLKLSGTTELIGSDAEFVQAEAFGKLILPLWKDARLLTRAEAGATLKDRLRNLPASVRFFAGGDYSVRGYDFETLGPTDEQGNVTGGGFKLVGSAEVDQKVWGNWSVAAFVDSGNAADSIDEFTFKTSVGGGIRWYSPLGPVRVDVAVPLEKDAPDEWRLHVTLGPDL